MSGTPGQPPLRTLLGRPWWQGVAAIVGFLALLVAVAAVVFQILLAPEPGNARDTVQCGVGGNGNTGATVKCGAEAAAASRQPSPAPAVTLRPTPTAPPITATAAPADTVPGTTIDTHVAPRRITPPATHLATLRPSPRPTTAAPPPPPPAPAQPVITAWDYPTHVAVYRGLTARKVDGQPDADFQVEARAVSPLHGARIAMPGPQGGCGSVDWTSRGLGFAPAEGTRLCLRTNLGEEGILEVRPDLDGERRPEPYAVRVVPAG